MIAKEPNARTNRRRRARLLTLALGVGLALTAVTAAAAGHLAAHSKLTIAESSTFSGANASYGTSNDAADQAAINEVNAAGGVLGDTLVLKNVDDKGDPVDAVPAANELVATTSNLVGIVGPGSEAASALVPIFNRAKIPMFAGTGQKQYNKNTLPYFWRLQPPDEAAGAATAYYAYKLKGYKTAAFVYGDDAGSQSDKPSGVTTYLKLGGKIVANLNLQTGASSYQTEALQVAQAKPQVIITEADEATSATFFRDLLNAGGLKPLVANSGDQTPTWVSTVGKAIGASTLQKYFTVIGVGGGTSRSDLAAAAIYNSYVKKVSNFQPFMLNQPVIMTDWDAVNITALAMLECHSTTPTKFNGCIAKIGSTPVRGAVVVHDYAQGKAALAAGKHIAYVGGNGPVVFNRYHNSSGNFVAYGANFVQNTVAATKATISGSTIASLLNKFGE
jgi:branched-chain amino acid transport system substrate-binding protein